MREPSPRVAEPQVDECGDQIGTTGMYLYRVGRCCGDIPHLSEDVARAAQPAAVKHFSDQIEVADAFIIVAPEYGHGMPGS